VQLPESLLESLKHVAGFDLDAFKAVHNSSTQVTSIRINPGKVQSTDSLSFEKQRLDPVPWTSFGYYLSTRPSFTFDPLFHSGLYYVQEASSMFLEQALKQTVDLSLAVKILDLSAAPGGKSTHIQSLISEDSLLVSNEVIRSRANVLKDNIIKWGADNVVVTNNDPRDFGILEDYFDVMVVDAPCSGSGLFRREPDAVDEWSLGNVSLCSQRQQRIIADAWAALKRGGILIYSTCSYSKEEDEEIMDWVTDNLDCSSVRLTLSNEWNIIESVSEKGCHGYRFWPDKIKGEGFFIACFRKSGGTEEASMRSRPKATAVTKKELEILGDWIMTGAHQFIKYENTVYAWPQKLQRDIDQLLLKLRVVYSGIRVGELIREKLVPDHALAMSHLASGNFLRVTVNYDQAIQYLQRREISIETKVRGWSLVIYQGYPLGWANILPNRINNYYPKELRILKDRV
jgi:16S rRNA C967 or C1407 C5-methylase (RsmB/RsmF family)/NOL1/NOP2/fmu family ribosome biogenesis protein